MNVDKLFRILGIKYSTRHSGRGIIYTVYCPYCSSGWHKHKNPSGAFIENSNKLYYTCFRGCSASVVEVLRELSGENINTVKETLALCSSEYKKQYETEEKKDVFVLPENIGMTQVYRDYLSLRGLNPEYVAKKYNLIFTPEVPYVYDEKQNLSNCIVFPIYHNGKSISFVARCVSKTSVIRYLFPQNSCAKDYGWSTGEDSDFVCIVEGTFDAMKLNSVGIPCLSCLGINYTNAFITNCLKRNYKKICVIFDPEPQAQKQQMQLINTLSLLTKTFSISYSYNHDLGDCTYGELLDVKKLIEEKLKKI